MMASLDGADLGLRPAIPFYRASTIKSVAAGLLLLGVGFAISEVFTLPSMTNFLRPVCRHRCSGPLRI